METTVLVLVYALIIITFVFEVWLAILNYQNRNAKIPDVVSDIYNEEEYKKWLDYNIYYIVHY